MWTPGPRSAGLTRRGPTQMRINNFAALILATVMVTAFGQRQASVQANPIALRHEQSPLCSAYERDRPSLVKMESSHPQIIAALDGAHKNAFWLAPGSDSAETIATSVASQECQLEIAEWTIAAEKLDSVSSSEAVGERISQGFKDDVVMEVLRARAGHCPAPNAEKSN